MSIKLLNFTSPDLVLARLAAPDREACLRAFVDRLVQLGKVAQGEALYREILAREEVETTGIGRGIAIPHVRSPQLVGSLVMVATLAEPVRFNAIDGEPVDLVFLLAGSRELPGQQLRLLARISKLVRIDSFLAELRSAETPADVIHAVRAAEAQHF
jgi:mannitol/fructose-specific phosphotransferase system IIA component (Ntr-type)